MLTVKNRVCNFAFFLAFLLFAISNIVIPGNSLAKTAKYSTPQQKSMVHTYFFPSFLIVAPNSSLTLPSQSLFGSLHPELNFKNDGFFKALSEASNYVVKKWRFLTTETFNLVTFKSMRTEYPDMFMALVVFVTGLLVYFWKNIIKSLVFILYPINFLLASLLRLVSKTLKKMRILKSEKNSSVQEDSLLSWLGLDNIFYSFKETDEAINLAGVANVDLKFTTESRLFWEQLIVQSTRIDLERNKDDPDTLTDDVKNVSEHQNNVQQKDFLKNSDKDFECAQKFFNIKVPIDSNALNLYDDIYNSFIVRIFSQSDITCFRAVMKYRNIFIKNIFIYSLVTSMVMALLFSLNIYMPADRLDIYHWFGMHQIETGSFAHIIQFDDEGIGVLEPYLGWLITDGFFNRFWFGLISCLICLYYLRKFYKTYYQSAQTTNALRLNNFLVRYLRNIEIKFGQVQNKAGRAAGGEATDAKKMAEDMIKWTTILRWLNFRIYFIQQFMRTTLYQVRRNGVLFLLIIPIVFIISVLFFSYIGIENASPFSTSSLWWEQSIFFLLFPIILYYYLEYQKKSLTNILKSFTDEQEDGAAWDKFEDEDFDLQNAMSEILNANAKAFKQHQNRYREQETN